MTLELHAVIAKCGHEVRASFSSEGECLDAPDCCAMCEELADIGRDDYDLPDNWK